MKRLRTFLIIFLSLFLSLIATERSLNTNPVIIILDSNDEEIVKIINKNKTNSVIEVNERLKKIIIELEDKTFYEHSGFDIYGIISASANNIFKKTSVGASTITQQYIKNTYLNNDKSIIRKLKEIYFSIRLENDMSKDEIFNSYLSCIYFGNNVYGITNAARYYFSKELKDISIEEMIALAALLKSPSTYSQDINRWNERVRYIAGILYNRGIITLNEYEEASKNIVFSYNLEFINSNKLFFIDAALAELSSLDINTKFNEKIYVHTRYNKKLEAVSDSSKINYACICADKSGYINCIIGNNNYYLSSYNIALNGKRDIGSTIKPLLYYEALKCKLNKKFYSAPFTYSYLDTANTVVNSSNYYTYSNIDLYNALAISDNTVAMQIHLALGTKTLANHLKKYNIEAEAIPSLGLGSVGMSLFELTKIYTQFFSYSYQHLRIIEKINLKNQEYFYPVKSEILLNQELVKKIDNLLEAPFDSKIAKSTCNFLNNNLIVSCKGKSGLTDYDSYMIGYSDNYLVSCYCGDINNNPLDNSYYKKLPKLLFQKIINIIEKSQMIS